MPTSHAARFEAALAPSVVNGSIGLGTFFRGFLDYLQKLVHDQIDTEEERDDIVAAVMAAADKLVAGKFPIGWSVVRASIQAFLDDAIDNLPNLI